MRERGRGYGIHAIERAQSRGRRRVDGVTGDAAKRAFFFAGAFLAAGFLAAGFLADFLAGAGSSSGSALLNGLIDLKKLTMAAIVVAASGFVTCASRTA